MPEEQIVLVDETDTIIGSGPKLAVHQTPTLHRAFSIFIFNSQKEMLLQRRALSKYHSGGLWTNACCGHQRPDETLSESAQRRLKEEMGIDCPLEDRFSFIYRAPLDHGLTEYEYDHVFFGIYDGNIQADPEEAMDWRWLSLAAIQQDIAAHPDLYTYWFKMILKRRPDISPPVA